MCVSLRGVELWEGAGVGHHAAHHLLVVVQRRSLTVAHVRQRRRHHTVLAHRVPRLKITFYLAILQYPSYWYRFMQVCILQVISLL